MPTNREGEKVILKAANDSDTSENTDATAAASRWWEDIGAISWPWVTKLKILFVIDGRITEGSTKDEFGLGPVLDTLRDDSFAWWVEFDVDVVRRDSPRSFRFTENGFDVNTYDQVWFFGDWPGEAANDDSVGDDIIERSEYSPMSDQELLIIAEWMERGGGVFATGDHALLGASMCHRIPRVRTMRKWTRAQGVPTQTGVGRHETLVRFSDGNYTSWEGDRWAQRIFPVYRSDTARPFLWGMYPHPLLCAPRGAITRFPDHMHEGAVVDTDNVALNLPLDIPGYDELEYPGSSIVVEPGGVVTLARVHDLFGVRPRPEVIAYGFTSNQEFPPKRFGLISVYDGDEVEVGRVVVDSTWHHWFSMNLLGFQNEAPDLYRGMQAYYRNVAMWLATPHQRASMLFTSTWGVVAGSQPGLFSRFMDIWDVGERVVDVIGRSASQCLISELVAAVLPSHPGGAAFATSPFRPPRELVDTLVIGGIALPLIELAQEMFKQEALGGAPELDPEMALSIAEAGAKRSRGELAALLDSTSADLAAMGEALSSTYQRSPGMPPKENGFEQTSD